MKLLKTRKFAILLTVVIALIATMLGVLGTASRDTRRIEAMFYNGVYNEAWGTTMRGMSAHIDNCADAALGLATFLKNYPQLADRAEELILAQRGIHDAKSISEKNSAFNLMVRLFYGLNTAANSLDLSSRDLTAVTQYYNEFRNAHMVMIETRYNDKVIEYLEGRSAIVRIISSFMPVKAPSYFTIPEINV